MDFLSRKPSARALRVVAASALMLMLQGCGIVFKTTGDILASFGRQEMVPYMMGDDDARMACATGEAQTPLLMSFERVGSHPDKLAVLLYVSASGCTDALAQEEELRYLRAVRAGNVAEAQDARIAQKRYAAMSARRQLESYKRMMAVYNPPKGECPRLKSDFDELVWLIGNLGGVQALVNDGVADGVVGVPRDIAPGVERQAACLERDNGNEQWWGAPRALRAAVWNLLPQLAPANAQPWKELENSAQIGLSQGVRLGSAVYAMSAYAKGDDARLREAIRDYANFEGTVDPDWRQIDVIAGLLVQGISDRMWTEATGKRTPVSQLGTFWDESSSNSSDVDIDDLL